MNKRSVRISGHDTSVTLEDEFWSALKNIAREKNISVNQLILEIDETRASNLSSNLSSALRLYVLQHLQEKLSDKY